MGLESIAAIGVSWLWETYGETITSKAFNKIGKGWERFKWKEAELKYRSHMKEQYTTIRILGNPKPITIENIFTDVYVLDKINAFRRFDINELRVNPLNRDSFHTQENRQIAIQIAKNEKRLYILGKPGAGKTTFLKHLVTQACIGKISKTPMFVSLKEWSDSGLELIPFLVQQFDMCAFPDALLFIEYLLGKGKALVLFDGLDEVKNENNQHSKTINALNNFSKKYPASQVFITCRVASTDYSFEQFTYLEIADFDDKQIIAFVSKWYSDSQEKLSRFLSEYKKPENLGLRELARTPLLLSVLCLAFDETLNFPANKADLYKEAFETLLKKWDSSRDIHRSQNYLKLSRTQKEQLLATLAAENFESGAYFIQKDTIANQIISYFRQLPNTEHPIDIEYGEEVLKDIESQHGVIIEYAHNIYAFSHLTFQEYLTARYITENISNGTIEKLIYNHCADNQWREVILLTVSMLNKVDVFFDSFFIAAIASIKSDSELINILEWIQLNAEALQQNTTLTRMLLLCIHLSSSLANAIDHSLSNKTNIDIAEEYATTLYLAIRFTLYYLRFHEDKRGIAAEIHDTTAQKMMVILMFLRSAQEDNYVLARDIAKNLPQALTENTKINFQSIENTLNQKLTLEQLRTVQKYLDINKLLLDCLQLANVNDRESVDTQLLKIKPKYESPKNVG